MADNESPIAPKEMGFSDAASKLLEDAKVDSALVWQAVQSKGQETVAALEQIFAKLLGR